MKLSFLKTIVIPAFISFTPIYAIQAAEPDNCKQVRLVEPGWTDLAFTSGVTQVLLESLGYKASSDILGMTVMLEAMKNKDADIMMGYWDPAMDVYIKKYLDEGSIEKVNVNLEGAKYTYAVPKYVHDAGVKDINDLAKYADKFGKKLYGLEAGSNGVIIDAIAEGKYGLSGWKVIESSEQGMLAQLARAVKKKQWIAIQAWEPHPMNVRFNIEYLTGTDDTYGPNFGGATIYTTARKGYTQECKNVGKLIKNMHFTLEMENIGMSYILDENKSATQAAIQVIKDNPEYLEKWLAGVNTKDGSSDALHTVRESLGLK
ncbi:MAG: choline ABC transporter substrate-binding protein [Arenicella sp.]